MVIHGPASVLDWGRIVIYGVLHRVLGLLRGLLGASLELAAPRLLDVGSGRGAFLWPLLDAFPRLRVTAIDREARCLSWAGAWWVRCEHVLNHLIAVVQPRRGTTTQREEVSPHSEDSSR